MRILILSWEYPPYVVGGMGKHVAELTPALEKLTTADEPLWIDVVTPRTAGGLPVEQVTPHLTVHRIDMPVLDSQNLYHNVVANNAMLVAYAARIGDQQGYDLIHIHDWLVGEAGITLKHRWKTPLVVTIHATERGRHQGYLPSEISFKIDQMEWRICYEAWRLIVCSQYMRGEVHYFFGAPYDKVEIIANGFDMQNATPITPTARAALRQQYAPHGEKLLFFVGRVTYEKGVQVLLGAMPEILAAQGNVRLLIAGKNGSTLWPLAHDLNIDRAVQFLGFISDAQRDALFQVVDAAIFPSLYEPFGIVALEAMAQNCNVIASNVGGLGEVVEHLKNGLTIYPNDAHSIAWAVNQLFADPAAAQQRRTYARTETLPLYYWDKIAVQTLQLYQRVIQERGQVDW